MAPAGLRCLFHHHDRCSNLPQANAHRLRHTFASETLWAGISLPPLEELLGHRSIRMTIRYVHVTQNDLQQQHLEAHQKIASLYVLLKLPIARNATTHQGSELQTICASLAAARHMPEMHLRGHADEKADKLLRRLTTRVAKTAKKLCQIHNTQE